MTANSSPIGVFDSGFGGLTVFRAIEALCPREYVQYFGDTARLPYGTKSVETVTRYALQVLDFFSGQGIKLMVVACNTVSSNAMDGLHKHASFPVVGVAEPGARKAARTTRNGKIGVVGTEATVGSGTYEAIIRSHAPDATVISKACPLFVPLVEEGCLEGELTDLAVKRYLEPLKRSGIDTLVLGCTHYPLLKQAIGRYMGSSITLVDSAQETAREVKRLLDTLGLANREGSLKDAQFFVTDSAVKFKKLGSMFRGREISEVHHVDL